MKNHPKVFVLIFLCLLYIFSSVPGSAEPYVEDAVLQEIATATFSTDPNNPSRMILSAWVCPATSSAAIGFYEAMPDYTEYSYGGVKVALSGVVTTFGNALGIEDYGIAHSVSQTHEEFGVLPWFRIYVTFNYSFDRALASHTYIVLQSDPDNIYSGATHSVWFDAVQFEKALFPGQTRPTTYSEGPKIVSPSQRLTLDGQRRYYEW